MLRGAELRLAQSYRTAHRGSTQNAALERIEHPVLTPSDLQHTNKCAGRDQRKSKDGVQA